jgi:stage III sporulation protein AF
MTAIYSFVRILAVYLLFVSVLLSILNNSPFQKYVQLFAGLFLILLAVRSFSSVFGEIDMEDLISKIEDMDDFSEQLSETQTVGEDFLKEEIQKEAEEKISELCENQGYRLRKAEIAVKEEYEIETIKIKVKRKKKEQGEESLEELKNTITDCLGLKSENIIIVSD